MMKLQENHSRIICLSFDLLYTKHNTEGWGWDRTGGCVDVGVRTGLDWTGTISCIIIIDYTIM